MDSGAATRQLEEIKSRLERHGQEHVLRFWPQLDLEQRRALLEQLATVDFPLMDRLVQQWVLNEPPPEHFDHIEPVPVKPPVSDGAPETTSARMAGEEALRSGRVGLLLVAGGQGTRLGFDGPKGAYPIGPISGKSLFEFHAEKIRNIQSRYGCTLPWYIMVSASNHEETRQFFDDHSHFGLRSEEVHFFEQRMVPCVDREGKFMLETPAQLAMNPNGHGGVYPAMVENGLVEDARARGVDTLSYFQVDNWAARLADPVFLGYHVVANAEISSKVHRKREPRESVGVHCLCDGEYRVIEYSELDIYPQLLETDADGNLIHFAGNPAIHAIDVGFIQRMYDQFDTFPWHRAFKKIQFIDERGDLVEPDKPNGYKFETFVFDAMRFIRHEPIALEIHRRGEYTPIKQFDGSNSVQAAWASMREYWAEWLEAAGAKVSRDAEGNATITIEISPAFALDKAEFVQKSKGKTWSQGDIGVDAGGELLQP